MKNFTSLLIIMIFAGSVTYSQQGSSIIEGMVVDAVTGEGLPSANVILENTTRGAAADQDGHFIIKRVPPGNYTIKAQMMGYEVIAQKIECRPDRNLNLKFDMRESYFQTQKIVVTATRTKMLMENVPVVTELITNNEIEETGAENIAQVLEDRPGIVIEEGVNGGKTLRMNGIDSKYILILVDGMPIAGKFNNRLELNLLDADDIEQIEIVKGPSSALYGSEAMGGVINIITKNYSEKLTVDGNGKIGSYDLYSGNISLKGSKNKFGYFLNADYSRGGIDQNLLSINVTDTEANKLAGKLRYSSEKLGEIETGTTFNQNIQDSKDPIFFNRADVKRVDNFIKWDKKISDRFTVNTKTFFNFYRRVYDVYVRNSGFWKSSDSTRENIIGVKTDFSCLLTPNYHLDFGVDYNIDRFKSDRVLNDKVTRNQGGTFAQVEINPVKKLTLILGGRYDKISDLDPYFSPRLSGMVSITNSLKFRGSYGGGFRAPSYSDMYIDFDHAAIGYRVIGNPDLKPERSTGATLGLEYFWNYMVLVNVNLFHNRFKDLILDYTIKPAVLSYRNIDLASFRGIEWQCKIYWLSNLTSTLAYNYTDVNQSEMIEDSFNLSPHTATLNLNYSIWKKRIRFWVRDQFFSERKVREFDRRTGEFSRRIKPKAAYNLLDGTVTIELNKMLSLRAGATNITDYTDVLYGPWIGRRLFTSLNINY